jgi:hypothetical protein
MYARGEGHSSTIVLLPKIETMKLFGIHENVHELFLGLRGIDLKKSFPWLIALDIS